MMIPKSFVGSTFMPARPVFCQRRWLHTTGPTLLILGRTMLGNRGFVGGGPLNVGWNCETTHSGQIIATSYDLAPPKRWFSKGNPVISRKSRLVKYDSIWPDSWFSLVGHLVERLLWISCRDVVCQHKWHVGWRSKHYIQHMMSSTPMFWPLWPRRGYFLQKRD